MKWEEISGFGHSNIQSKIWARLPLLLWSKRNELTSFNVLESGIISLYNNLQYQYKLNQFKWYYIESAVSNLALKLPRAFLRTCLQVDDVRTVVLVCSESKVKRVVKREWALDQLLPIHLRPNHLFVTLKFCPLHFPKFEFEQIKLTLIGHFNYCHITSILVS